MLRIEHSEVHRVYTALTQFESAPASNKSVSTDRQAEHFAGKDAGAARDACASRNFSTARRCVRACKA
jgi:hypothetical protein